MSSDAGPSSDLAPFASLDHLATVEIRRGTAPRGFIRFLYESARDEVPITYSVARELVGLDGDRVAIATGVVDPSMFPRGEVDGPVGAVFLSRALEKLGVAPTVMVEGALVPPVKAIADAAGVGGLDVRRIDIDDLGDAQMERESSKYAAAIAIEALGPNAVGAFHFVTGRPYRNPLAGYADRLVRAVAARGRPTVGIGDGGNEVGFGRIRDRVTAAVPYGAECQCGCGGGVACVTPASLLLPCSVSNWGAYAVVSALALVADEPTLLISREDEEAALRAAVSAGCRDGVTLRQEPRQDGVDLSGCLALVELLGQVVAEDRRRYTRVR